MSDTSPPNRASYPYIPLKSWFLLRRKFQQSLPKGEVTPTYIASLLSVTEDSAKKNVIRGLRDIGFLTDENRLTDLAIDWRLDEKYADVCKSIVSSIYPHELTDLYPNPAFTGEEGKVRDWFAKTTKLGGVAIGQVTAFYSLLANGDLAKSDNYKDNNSASKTKPKGKQKAEKKISAVGRSVDNSDGRDAQHIESGSSSEKAINIPSVQSEKPKDNSELTLHIDLQIHISPDSSSEQIDKIFSSISKYIYRRSDE